VVIGASAGGIEAMTTIAAGLPSSFAAPICVVIHSAPSSPGTVDRILGRAAVLPVATAASDVRVERGHIYVAPLDYHLVLEPGRLRLSKGPRENRSRPAIDPLFRSAAQVYGPGAIGVILTGNLDDGTAGLWAVKERGGIAIVQDPADAQFPSMPESAIRHVAVDHVLPVSDMAALLARLVAAPVRESEGVMPDDLPIEVDIAKGQNAVDAGIERIGAPSAFACPECHGVLLRIKEGHPLRFRCHTGHAYSVENLVAAVNEGIEEALWSAMRALEEGALLIQQLSDHVQEHRDSRSAETLAAEARDAHQHANTVRGVAVARAALKTPES
jgi:two-component system chemotaxis response regulator CheB